MSKSASFVIDEDVYEKFLLAMNITKDSESDAIEIAEQATITMMERLCSDKEYPELYVPTFRNNYSQLKIDGPKSHGRVFEDDGENVWIWSEVEDTLMKYKSSFYNRGDENE